ncbi:DEAD/DEAH box helicase family protein, partial [bacterium]|nr:DEAD/DEAH box helicase family protein [bacterium]
MEERPFKLVSPFQPTGDQPEAIKTLVEGLRANKRYQVLLGATGTGKTYTIANVIAQIQRPTLVMVHNKTLAGQLYSELKSFFPENRVEYFISNFDFYQPEAYIPKSDTYIEKSADMNMEIEMMRNAAINSALTRGDTIIVASVAAIYALNDPEEYSSLLFSLRVGESINRRDIVRLLINAQYKRTMLDLVPGSFRVRGDVLEIAPPYTDRVFIRVELFADVVERISEVDPLAGTTQRTYQYIPIYPAESHASSQKRLNEAVQTILEELVIEVQKFKDAGKLLEAERLDQRTRRDVEQIEEYGICPGIENYSRHIDKRKKGEAPFTIMDYFKERNYLVIVDESHVSLPQIRGMYNGDRSRKETLVKYGFRLPSALDNRPLKFAEFEKRISNVIFTSAT